MLLLKRYNIAIISFILLSSLIGKPLFASPGDHEANINGVTSDPGPIGWYVNTTHITVTASASNSGVVTCTNPSTTITASTTASGTTTYSWTGPNSFTAVGSSITVSTAGTYTVTGSNSGKTGSASVTVTSDTAAPPTMMADNTGPLTCTNTSSTLILPFGSATGITVTWIGPNGFNSTDAFPIVSVPGTYYLKVTYTATGCTTLNPTTITQDTAAPASVSAGISGQLTCMNTSVTLTGSCPTSGVTYAWTGPNGFTASTASTTVSTPGNYVVTVTNPSNGCSTFVTAPAVTQNITVPGGVSASVSDRLTCNVPSVTLTGNSTTSGVTYAWSGPNGFSSSSRVTTTTAGGAYSLKATDPTNGCSFSTSITVQADVTPPAGVTAISAGNLSCTVGDVILTGSSTTPGVNYSWTGPNGFVDPEQTTDVTDSGTYTVLVTNPTNGCSATAIVAVTADFTECSMVLPKAITGQAATMVMPTGTDSTTGAAGLTYKVYPNPVNTTAFIDLNSPQKTHVSVEVYNSLGVREQILFEGIVEAGTPYKWTLDASRLTAGVHYCIIRTNKKVYTSKLLISGGRP